MARAFDGADDYLALSAGGVSAIDGGPITVVVVVKLADHDVGGVLTARPAAGGFTWALAVSAGDWYFGAGDIMNVFSASTADGWTLVAVTKAGGTATPRGHKYVYGTNTWTHANGAGTVSDAGAALGSGGTVEFGRWDNYSEYSTADIAVGAVWDRVLTDAEVELLAHSLTSWYAAAPAGMWVLDQDATTQAVVDATGGGANQSALTGTTVAAGSAPIGYGRDILASHSIPAGGTTHDADAAATTTATTASTAAVDRAASAASTSAATVASTALVDRAADAASATTATAATTATVDRPADAATTTTAAMVSTAAVDRAANATQGTAAAITGTATVDRSTGATWTVTATVAAETTLDLPAAASAPVVVGINTTATADRAALTALVATATATATASLIAPGAATATVAVGITATATVGAGIVPGTLRATLAQSSLATANATGLAASTTPTSSLTPS